MRNQFVLMIASQHFTQSLQLREGLPVLCEIECLNVVCLRLWFAIINTFHPSLDSLLAELSHL